MIRITFHFQRSFMVSILILAFKSRMTHEKLHNAIYFFVLLTIPPNKQDMAVEALKGSSQFGGGSQSQVLVR